MTDQSSDTHPFTPLDTDSLPPEELTNPEPERRGGCGCWVTVLTTLVVFTALVVIGLFLPPINLYQRFFAGNFVTLTSSANAVASSGLTLAAYDLNPGETLDVTLNTVPMDRFLAGDSSAGTWIPDALAAVPPSLALQSSVYGVEPSSANAEMTLSIDLPPDVNPDILDLYGWSARTKTWQFIPAHPTDGRLLSVVTTAPDRVALFQAAPINQPSVLVAYDVTQVLSSDASKLATIVAPAGLQPTLDGKLVGNLAAGFDLNAGYLVTPSIRNYADPRATDPDTIAAILANSSLRRTHAAQIAAFASGYDGVLIDYRDLPAELSDAYSAFIADLAQQLHQAGLLLIVAVPSAVNEDGSWNTGAYDWRALGAAVDYLQINLDASPTDFIPGADRPVEALLRWAVGEVSRDKLLLGLTALSQQQVGDSLTPIGYQQALSALGDVEIDAQKSESGTVNPGDPVEVRLNGYRAQSGSEPNTMQPYVDYLGDDDSTVARMWLTTSDALRYRMDRTVPFALGGIAFDDLLSSGTAPDILDAILNYKIQIPSTPQALNLALRWTIQGINGVVDSVTTGLNEGIVTTIQAPDGNYAVNVEVVGDNDNTAAQRSGAAVAVFAPTPTPTPLPTSTPTPTPRPTSVPQAVVAAPSGGGQAAAPPARAASPGAASSMAVTSTTRRPAQPVRCTARA